MLVSKFEILAARLRAQIASGQLKPGDRLPSASVLQAEHKISWATVRSAMLTLKSEGLVRGRAGDGVFVEARVARRAERCAGPLPPLPRLYQAIVDDIKADIAQGALKPGDRLPTYTALRERYTASYGRVRDAIMVLRAEGVVARGRGGLRVTEAGR